MRELCPPGPEADGQDLSQVRIDGVRVDRGRQDRREGAGCGLREVGESRMSQQTDEMERKAAERRQRDFDAWIGDPITRMCISTIPAAERPEALQLLLKSAFDRGFVAGQGYMVGSL